MCVCVLQVFVIVREHSFPKEFHPYPDDCTKKKQGEKKKVEIMNLSLKLGSMQNW